MGAAAKYVHKLTDSPATVSLTTAWQATGRKDITVPSTVGMDGICGKIGCVRLYGLDHSAAAKEVFIIVTYNQAGNLIWLGEQSALLTHSMFSGTEWQAHVKYDILGSIKPSECPEGTISIFAKLDGGTADWNDAHFLWEE